MKSLAKKVQRFLVSEDGPTAVEYAVMLALIVIVCLTAISAIGTNANATFNDVANQLSDLERRQPAVNQFGQQAGDFTADFGQLSWIICLINICDRVNWAFIDQP